MWPEQIRGGGKIRLEMSADSRSCGRYCETYRDANDFPRGRSFYVLMISSTEGMACHVGLQRHQGKKNLQREGKWGQEPLLHFSSEMSG